MSDRPRTIQEFESMLDEVKSQMRQLQSDVKSIMGLPIKLSASCVVCQIKPYPPVTVTHPDGTTEPAQWYQEGQDWVFNVKAGDTITTMRVEPNATSTISIGPSDVRGHNG